ncbi:MAG: hypothetical protein R6X17_13285, partial [Candidatus Competibacteraceae bacterium]
GDSGTKVETPTIPYAPDQEAMGQGPEAFQSYFQTIRGQNVQWSGRVVETTREFGDDYAEFGWMHVDMDTEGQGQPGKDIMFVIKPSQIKEFTPGQSVSFAGVIEEYAAEGGNIVLKLEVKKVEKVE